MFFQAKDCTNQYRLCRQFGDERIQVTDRMLLKNGKPWLPVMGELHYSRVPCEKWEETLAKMKEGGIDVVASYVFWIHHEEEKGVFDFSGNRDIRRFIQLCHQQGMEFCLRIGPWAHGECRNGGFPDWLCAECRDSLRSGREPYFGYVRRYIRAVADQVRGLPLFGIQVENEMTHRPEYMEQVRQLILEAGLSAPLYTATGWGRARLPETLLPMFGGYPEAPWTGHTRPLGPNSNYFFSHIREDGCIGSDVLGTAEASLPYTGGKTPFMTCELGGGNQITYHRRPLFSSLDIEALPICKLGSGVNLLGYYVYTGGLNPVGKTTMQESKATGYPNDCPVISYDFQAPIGDMGQLRESWHRLAVIHRFVHAFGEMLAPMEAVMPDEAPASLEDTQTLRCALRSDGESGFLFVNNHVRLQKLPAHPGHRFVMQFRSETVEFSLDVPADSAFFLPVNLKAAGLHIRYATAQPVSRAEKSLELIAIPGIEPAVTLADGRSFPLAPGVNRIDQTEVILLSREKIVPSPLTEIVPERSPNRCDGEILLGHLGLEDRTVEYTVRWAPGDQWMVIRARGNLAGFYAEGKMISDCFCCGDAWVIDLRRLPVREGCIKIQPFTEEDRGKVYLEIPFETGIYPPDVRVCREDRLLIGNNF